MQFFSFYKMKLNFYSLVFNMLWFSSFAQLSSGVYDRNNKMPVSFANVYVKGKKNSATANGEGRFVLRDAFKEDELLVTAIGYADLTIEGGALTDSVFLRKQAIELEEVTIAVNKRKYEKIKSGFLRNEKTLFGELKALMIGKYFAPKGVYKSYPYLQGFTLMTYNDVKGAFINVSLRGVTSDGKPGEYLYGKNLAFEVKRKLNKVYIDLSDESVRLPEDGFFIFIERINGALVGDAKVSYVPIYRDPDPEASTSACCMYPGGEGFKWVESANSTLAIELELSN